MQHKLFGQVLAGRTNFARPIGYRVRYLSYGVHDNQGPRAFHPDVHRGPLTQLQGLKKPNEVKLHLGYCHTSDFDTQYCDKKILQ